MSIKGSMSSDDVQVMDVYGTIGWDKFWHGGSSGGGSWGSSWDGGSKVHQLVKVDDFNLAEIKNLELGIHLVLLNLIIIIQ